MIAGDTIPNHAENIVLVLQGRLSGDAIAEAELSAQPKAAKPKQTP